MSAPATQEEDKKPADQAAHINLKVKGQIMPSRRSQRVMNLQASKAEGSVSRPGRAQPPPGNASGALVRADILGNVRKCGAVDFMGASDPTKAMGWLEAQDMIYDYLGLDADLRFDVTLMFLKEAALQWWKTMKQRYHNPFQITWDQFQQEFRKKYIPDSYVQEKLTEFESLQQGIMTVDEYAQKFTYLSQFALKLTTDEEERCKRFEKGLCLHVKDKLVALRIHDFQELVDVARRCERVSLEFKKLNKEKKQKKEIFGGGRNKTTKFNQCSGPSQGRTFSNSFLSQQATSMGPVSFPANPRTSCFICGKTHSGRCLQGSNRCFQCRQEGHIKKYCPFANHARMESQQTTSTYASQNHQEKGQPSGW